MIFHASIAVENPADVGDFFAALWGGEVFPFHPVEGGVIVLHGSDDGSAVEIYPAGTVNRCGSYAVSFERKPALPAGTATHLAVATPHSANEVTALAARHGWLARHCDRGPFDLIEVWVEGTVLVEVLTPGMQARYRAAMTRHNWRAWS